MNQPSLFDAPAYQAPAAQTQVVEDVCLPPPSHALPVVSVLGVDPDADDGPILDPKAPAFQDHSAAVREWRERHPFKGHDYQAARAKK